VAQDRALLELLLARRGVATTVELTSGVLLDVNNIVFGYDEGADQAHVTTNINPFIEGESVEVFMTGEIVAVRDAGSGTVLYKSN